MNDLTLHVEPRGKPPKPYQTLSTEEQTAVNARKWENPTPLPPPGAAKKKDYPLQYLPISLVTASQEVARFSKTPVSSSSVIGLSIAAVAIGKKALVEERGPRLAHYPSLFYCLVGQSGIRKSGPFEIMQKPLLDWQNEAMEAFETLKITAMSNNEAIDSAKAKALRKSVDVTAIDSTSAELAKLEKKRIPLPIKPKLFTTDVSEQRVVQELARRDGIYAVLSSEGRKVIDHILGKYSGGHPGDSIYLAGISGDTTTRDRVGSDGIGEDHLIQKPCLNVCVMVQEDKWQELSSHRTLRSSGLIARIWPVMVDASFGERLESEGERDLDGSLLEGYTQLIQKILEHEPKKDDQGKAKPHRAQLSKEAKEQRRRFYNSIEERQADGADFADVRDIASKAVSQTCKVALILHLLYSATA